MKLHYGGFDSYGVYAACGRYWDSTVKTRGYITDKKHLVSCEKCKESKRFKEVK